MEAESQRPNGWEGAILALDVAVKDSNVTVKVPSILPVKAVLRSVIVLLTLIGVYLLLSRHDLPPVHAQLELDGQQTGWR